MTRLRDVCALIAALCCFSVLASADLKIKTRSTAMGHTTESTVYIKGARERREMSLGGREGMATVTQCDQKRIITITGNRCMIMQMGGGETSCPVMPSFGSLMKGAMRGDSDAPPPPPRKGGVLTITRDSTDTGERQDMFGYKARHIKTSMSMESSPDACNQSHMKMETDGWYADVSTAFSCGDESVRSLACAGTPGKPQKEGCSDRIVMKGGGGVSLGYPLKQTTTITTDGKTYTTSTEVLELTNATVEAPLFEMPPGCQVTNMSSLMGGGVSASQPVSTTPTSAPKRETTPVAPAEAAPPPVAPKAEGVIRIGVVKLKDVSGESLPTDSLQINLISEVARHQFEVVPLVADVPQQEVDSEARAKQCDYILFTTVSQVKAPGSGGLSSASLPKGVALDAAKFQALTEVTLYKVGKPLPELKDLGVAAAADQFGVNAVMATFEKGADRVAQQVQEDAHPTAASKTQKTPAKQSATRAKPK